MNIEPRSDIPLNAQSSSSNILGILDKTRTAQGKRLLGQWVRQPLRDLALIKERHDVVATLLENSEVRTTLSEELLRKIPDLQQLAKRLGRKKAGLQDIYKYDKFM